MSKINLRGVIVPSEYDQEWLASYIEKGMFVPESHFRSELAGASTEEPLTVHVNSPGGSVFSAYEMVNAVLAWKQETGQSVVVDIGAMAASAASAFAVMCGDVINCYPNSKMMFHSATTVTLAGPQGHADTADLLNKINQDIQNVLISRYSMDESMVAEWFNEGREGWLTADEMKGAGVVTEVMASFVTPVEFSAEDIDNVKDRGLDVAALFESGVTNMSEVEEVVELAPESASAEEVVAEVVVEAEPEAVAEEAPAEESTEEVEAEVVEEVEDVGEAIEEEPSDVSEVAEPAEDVPTASSATDIAYDEGFLAGERSSVATANEDLITQFAEKEIKLASRDLEVDSLKTLLAGANKERDELSSRLNRLTAGFVAPEQEQELPSSWRDAVVECGGGEEGYFKAKAKYGNLFTK